MSQGYKTEQPPDYSVVPSASFNKATRAYASWHLARSHQKLSRTGDLQQPVLRTTVTYPRVPNAAGAQITTIAARWKQGARLELLPNSTMHSLPSCTRKHSGCVSPSDAAAQTCTRDRAC